MAGIGFELKKMMAGKGWLGVAQAYTYSGIIGSGPWVFPFWHFTRECLGIKPQRGGSKCGIYVIRHLPHCDIVGLERCAATVVCALYGGSGLRRQS